MRDRVEQPTDDLIDDSWLVKLASAMARKPTQHVGRRAPLRAARPNVARSRGTRIVRVLHRAVLPIFARHFKRGEHIVPLPTLTVATMADVADRTAAESLKRLRVQRGVLRLSGRRARSEDANRYSLVPATAVHSHGDEGPHGYPLLLRSSTFVAMRKSSTPTLRDISAARSRPCRRVTCTGYCGTRRASVSARSPPLPRVTSADCLPSAARMADHR